MQELDPRIVRVGIQVNNQLKLYEGLAISISGTKFANANQNECEIKITNLDKATRDYILTETSPFNKNRTPKIAIVEAGRVSYGTNRIYSGNIAAVTVSQPPDIEVTLKCLTGNFSKGDIVARNQPNSASLSKISKQIAGDLGLTLNFQAKDKSISNYNYTGSSLKQVDKLQDMAAVNAYVDDGELIVKEFNLPLSNTIRILDKNSGMIGIPEITEFGVKVKFLLDGSTKLGSLLRIVSELYPIVNGDYIIYKLSFEIASRDVPFYWIAEAKRT